MVAISLYHLIEFLKLVSAPLDIVDRQKFPTFLVDFLNRLATFMAREFCYRSFPLPSLRAFVHESHVFLAKWSNETSSEVAFIADNLV